MDPGTGATLVAFRPVPLSLEVSRVPTRPPHWMLDGAVRAYREGGDLSHVCFSLVPVLYSNKMNLLPSKITL